MGLELVLELVAETPKTKNRENLTFAKFSFFLNDKKIYLFGDYRRYLSKV